MNKHMAIAIDGPSGAGKSSLARRCAEQQGFLYVDTGAIYRTLGLAVLRKGIDRRDENAVMELLPQLKVELKYNEEGEQRMFLGPEHAGQAFFDVLGGCPDPVVIGDDGYGVFSVGAQNLSVWVREVAFEDLVVNE